jgi:peptidyl-dipeptidase Dcp
MRTPAHAQSNVNPEAPDVFPISPPSSEPSDFTFGSLLYPSALPLGAPPFHEIEPGQFRDAARTAMALHRAELDEIAANPSPATFENTLEALERSGQPLDRVVRILEHLASTDSTPEIREIRGELAPLLAGHRDDVRMNEALFARIDAVRSELAESAPDEQHALAKAWHDDFVRSGIRLDAAGRGRLREINAALASLSVSFQDQLLEASQAGALVVEGAEALAGLSSEQIAVARAAAAARGLPEGTAVLELVNTVRQPLLASLDSRETRRRLWQASVARGTGGVDTRPNLLEQARLRAEKARLLGFRDWASFILDHQVAKTPHAAHELLTGLVPAVRARIDAERAAIRQEMAAVGLDGDPEPWDWAWFSERVRRARHGLDEAEVREFFELEQVLEGGLFATMEARYGIRFERREDIPVPHPEMRVYTVREGSGDGILGLFYLDLFARPSKRGGAWMSAFQVQSELLGTLPLIVNVLNIPKPPEGSPALVDPDHVTTLFHEMGHGLHGLLSKVRYPRLSGTAVPRDFVELPSTFEEDWALDPEVLRRMTRHPVTGLPLPPELADALRGARHHDQGYDTFEYLAAAILDLAWHGLALEEVPQTPDEVEGFEREALQRAGVLDPTIPPRYLSPIFAHIWGYAYAAGYYAYMWSEVMAADAFELAVEEGGTAPGAGARYRAEILARGSSRDPMKSFEAYRGRGPSGDALLRRRGLTA